MIETVEVTIKGKKYTYNKDTTLFEIAQDFKDDFKYPIILARVGNRLKELTTPVGEECEIEFLDFEKKACKKC